MDRIIDVDKIIPIVNQNSRSSVAFSEGGNVVVDGASGTKVIVVGGVSVADSVSMKEIPVLCSASFFLPPSNHFVHCLVTL